MATRIRRPSFDPAAAFSHATTFHEHGHGMHAPLCDAAIQSGASIGSHPALHLMAHRPGTGGTAVIAHAEEFAAHRMFVPAELTHYITRA